MNPNDYLDRILDHALSEYRDAEPLSGMEDRILRRLTVQPKPSSRRWAWILAAVSASAAVIVAVLWLGYRERPPQSLTARATQSAPQPEANPAHVEGRVVPSAQPHRAARARSASGHPATAVKQQVAKADSTEPEIKQFPAPVPMTSQEHALLALARTHPDALLAPRDDAGKLSIAPIEIKPLASEAGAPQGEQ